MITEVIAKTTHQEQMKELKPGKSNNKLTRERQIQLEQGIAFINSDALAQPRNGELATDDEQESPLFSVSSRAAYSRGVLLNDNSSIVDVCNVNGNITLRQAKMDLKERALALEGCDIALEERKRKAHEMN